MKTGTFWDWKIFRYVQSPVPEDLLKMAKSNPADHAKRLFEIEGREAGLYVGELRRRSLVHMYCNNEWKRFLKNELLKFLGPSVTFDEFKKKYG